MYITTQLYKITPEQYAAIIALSMLKRYRYIIYLVFFALLIGSLTLPDFKYAAVVLLFGVVPFVIFNITFKSMGMYKLDILFKPKHLIITERSITIVDEEGEETQYNSQNIEFKHNQRKNHLLTIDGNKLLMIPYKAFKTYADHQNFKNHYIKSSVANSNKI